MQGVHYLPTMVPGTLPTMVPGTLPTMMPGLHTYHDARVTYPPWEAGLYIPTMGAGLYIPTVVHRLAWYTHRCTPSSMVHPPLVPEGRYTTVGHREAGIPTVVHIGGIYTTVVHIGRHTPP